MERMRDSGYVREHKHAKRQKAGFSLVEILIALAVLSIGIMAVMRLFPISLRHAQGAQEHTIASELANERLGRVWTAGANQLFEKDLEASEWLTMRQAVNSYSIYDRYNATVQRMAGAGDVYLQRVTFSVQMADGSYETFVTYVSQL
jgi:prepilin-type N-terminal cleavage/methylation domain-containing protein